MTLAIERLVDIDRRLDTRNRSRQAGSVDILGKWLTICTLMGVCLVFQRLESIWGFALLLLTWRLPAL